MSIPSEYRATPLLLELQVLRGGGVGVPGMRAVGVDAVLRHVWLEPRGRVPEGGGDDEDHAVQLLLLPRGEIRGSLHRAQAALDPDRAELGDDRLAHRVVGRERMEIA